MANSITNYIQKVHEYADFLAANKEHIPNLVELFNQKGEEYFGSHRSGYIRADPEDVADDFTKEIYNKAEFIAKVTKDFGYVDEDPEEASFDDSFRHTIFINISDMEHPTLVEPPAGLLQDSILHWDAVQRLPELFPDGNTIAVHLDAMTQIFFPIPTKTSGGKRRGRKRRTRKQKQSRKHYTR